MFRDKYFEILNRFYLTFESIYQYAVTLNSFVKDLSNGVYIQQTLETIFQDVEGKQLLVSVWGDGNFLENLHSTGQN